MKKSSMNIPNLLSLIRVCLVPLFVVSLIYMRDIRIWGLIVPAAIYGITGYTDFLDGRIARKYNLVTDFGKFIDPLADKFMVIGSQIAILAWMMIRGENTLALVFVWVVLIILLRELGVTSLRLVVAGKSGIVVAASMLGKIKTVSQMIGSIIIILEPLLLELYALSSIEVFATMYEYHILSYAVMAIITFTTLFSGLDYLKAYLPYIDSNK